uniref:GOLD domain-containing protein n=1 Tax=Arcella intermedia TaxID=1963864 RepID=A0A6B2LJV4_9EUKA
MLLACCLCREVAALSFLIEAKTEECFYETANAGDNVGVMFTVTKGGRLDIDIRMIDPFGTVISGEKKQSQGRYSFTAAHAGSYAVCFNNEMSSFSTKIIDMDIEVTEPDSYEEIEAATEEELIPLLEILTQLRDNVKNLLSDQKYLEMRDLAHIATNESTNNRVFWWGAFELIILFGSGLFQVFYLRRIFEKRSSI